MKNRIIFFLLTTILAFTFSNCRKENDDNSSISRTNEGIAIADSIAYTGGDFPSFIGTYVFTTTDGGNNWIKSDFLKQFSFGRVVFVSDNFAYCISNKYIFKLQKK